MKKILITIAVSLVFFISGCDKNLPEVGGTSAEKVANEWWVTLKLGDADLIGTHVKLSTYNTAANDDSIWIDDLENTWQFKCKAKVDYNNLSFKTEKAQNEYYDIKVTIDKGKILPGAGLSKTGNVTDSIYMEATFSDDRNNTYIISGHARTRFVEDEY